MENRLCMCVAVVVVVVRVEAKTKVRSLWQWYGSNMIVNWAGMVNMKVVRSYRSRYILKAELVILMV